MYRFSTECTSAGARRFWVGTAKEAYLQLQGANPCVYEVVQAEQPLRALYVDLDAPKDGPCISLAVLQNVQAACCKALKESFPSTASISRVIVACSSRADKQSYHIQVHLSSPYTLQGTLQIGHLVRKFVHPCAPWCVDLKPYSRKQNWRVLGARKCQEGAPRLFSCKSQRMPTLEEFQESLLGTGELYVCAQLPPALPSLAQQVVSMCKSLLPEQCVDSPQMHDHYIIVPSRCRKCCIANRVHRSNHIYAVIDLKLQTLRIKCHAEECSMQEGPPAKLLPAAARKLLSNAYWPPERAHKLWKPHCAPCGATSTLKLSHKSWQLCPWSDIVYVASRRRKRRVSLAIMSADNHHLGTWTPAHGSGLFRMCDLQ